MEIKETNGKTYLIVPHEGEKLTFQYPSFKGNLEILHNEIDKASLKRPNSPEIASLLYDAFQNPKGKYESEIIWILNEPGFREFVGNLYLPKSNEKINNGVIIEYNPKIENGKLIMNKNDLIKKLIDGSPNVKFVPFGFPIGEHVWGELQKNPYIIARYGKEGAEKIAKIASNFPGKPYLWSLNSTKSEITKGSLITRNWFGNGLSVICDYYVNITEAFSQGILPSAKVLNQNQ